ncbi:hypothetical protein ACIA5G_13780 [Amycolatopsis sp. NPDC051758]|uniref:hypothetical protein n=1 Tax=Amycolatopsis sp. NPDC051758 TaxID=3363935 RepID=UPI0037A2FBB0
MRVAGSPPYFSQWESPDLVGAIIRGEVRAEDDPRWRESGAESRAEYAFWSWRACGMACLRTVLAARRGTSATTMGLGKEVLAAGGHRWRPDGLDGLIYAPFAGYLRERWDIAAEVRADLRIDEVCDLVSRGDWVMASVNPKIRRPADHPERRGGHLVLVHGLAGDELVLHNPSGDGEESQAGARVGKKDFARFYADRGVVFPHGEQRLSS